MDEEEDAEEGVIDESADTTLSRGEEQKGKVQTAEALRKRLEFLTQNDLNDDEQNNIILRLKELGFDVMSDEDEGVKDEDAENDLSD